RSHSSPPNRSDPPAPHRSRESDVGHLFCSGSPCSLSSGERAGVRGTETIEYPSRQASTTVSLTDSAFGVVAKPERPTLPPPSPRPSPPGRGRTRARVQSNSEPLTSVLRSDTAAS